MTPKPQALSNRLLATLATGFLLAATACGGDGAADIAIPTQDCSAALEIGTPCVPAEDSFIHEAFEGRSTPAEATELMDDGRFGGSLVCAEKPDDSVMCAMAVDGAAVVYPINMPDNRKLRFSGGDLDEPIWMGLAEGVPLGIRYSGSSMQISVMIEREIEGETVDDEYYFVNTIEVEVPAGPAPVQPDDGADEDAESSDE